MSSRIAAAMMAAAGLLLSSAVPAQTPAAPTVARPLPITDFFKRPVLREPKLSPNGRYLAVQTAGADDRMWLAVIDLETMSPPKVVASFRNADVYRHAGQHRRVACGLARRAPGRGGGQPGPRPHLPP